MSRRRNTAAAPIPANTSISASQSIAAGAPTAVHEVEMLKKLLEAEKEKVILQQETITILKADKAFLQEQLSNKEDFIRELRTEKAGASGAGVKPPRKPSQICITDESSEELDVKSSALSDSSEGDLTFKKGQVKRKKKSHSQRDEKGPTPKHVSDHSRVRVRNTRAILTRYMKALKAFQDGKSMKTAFDSVGVDRSTIARTSPIAELKIAAPEVFKALPPWYERTEKLSSFIDRCRAAMTIEIKENIKNMKSNEELLPFATSL